MSAAERVQNHPVYVQAQGKASYYIQQLDKELNNYPALKNLESRTQVPKAYLVIGSVVLLLLLHAFNSLAAPVSNIIGWVLPAYFSLKALETPGPQDDIQWLTYWVVFGFFNLFETLALRILLYYFSWYFAFKSLFILWLQLPAFRGAQVTYGTVIKPLFQTIDQKRVVVTQPQTTNTQPTSHTD